LTDWLLFVHATEQGINPCHQMQNSTFAKQWKWELQLKGSQCTMQEALLTGSGFAVCDGSFKDANGATA